MNTAKPTQTLITDPITTSAKKPAVNHTNRKVGPARNGPRSC